MKTASKATTRASVRWGSAILLLAIAFTITGAAFAQKTIAPPKPAAAPVPLSVPKTDTTYSRGADLPTKTALDEYVYTPDPAFACEMIASQANPKTKCTTTAYHLTSQTWLDTSKVDRPLWEHVLYISVPDTLKYKSRAMMFIGGGGNGPNMARDIKVDNGPLEQIATLTGSVVCQIKQIPNQPLHFVGDKDKRYDESGRKEDAIIAFGWDKFLSGDTNPIWLARLPMTKAVVRAMDIVQQENPDIKDFFVAGGSKRGWTTWTTAAVDKRVIGIAPCIIDVLNFIPSLENHYKAYGFWAPAVSEYVDMDITGRLHTPEMKKLLAIVDPYSYRDRLTMPKYICNSSGDQFFPPNSWQFYWNDLQGEKEIMYVPNTDHGLNAGAYMRLASYYHSVLSGTPRPSFSWTRDDKDGSLHVKCETKPSKVTLWQATNPDARDFRLESLGPKYTESPLAETKPGEYDANIKAPEKGWTAFFIEVQFPSPDFPMPFVFTTGISIVPDTYPEKK
jgi:PhoPQ-activated pathogenicity-related protein